MCRKGGMIFKYLPLGLVSLFFAAPSLAADIETVGDLKVSGVIESTSGGFKFPDGSTLTTSGLDGLLFNVGFVVDNSASNTGTLNSGAVKFGGDASGEGIASQRTTGVSQNGIDFYTNFTSRLIIKNNGYVGIGTRDPSDQLEITGNLRLPATTATTGIIKSGYNTLLHSFGPMNFFAGVGAGNTSMEGSRNTGVGESALHVNSSGGWNAGVGSYVLTSNTTGSSNSALGSHALYGNTTGQSNTAVGNGALYANVTGSYNTAVGSNALWDSTGYGNTAVGTGSQQQNTTGSYNTAMGRSSLGSNLTGGFNAAYGYNALYGNTSGSNNTAFGYDSGYTTTSANANTTGSNNTFIGYNSGPGTATQLTNATAIGANALVSQSNSLVLGGAGATAVKVGIGTATPTETLDVVGNVRINDSTIYLRGNNGDNAHGLGWFNSSTKPFMGTSFNDGPVLFGAGGGALGTWAGSSHIALTWDSSGNVSVTGTLSKGSGSFKIDHPLDPRNKYLYHSFVESPDMKNIYDGTVTTDEHGYADVVLPEWFEALNRDFRYQLTVLDVSDSAEFVQAKIVRKIRANSFTIRTSRPSAEVSWQVTGIRKDAYAEKHRIRVEEEKPADERGRCLHPEACGE